jgi:hypothetical protein
MFVPIAVLGSVMAGACARESSSRAPDLDLNVAESMQSNRPSDIEETVSGADAIAVVELGALLDTESYALPTDSTEPTPDPEWEPTWEPFMYPYTDYAAEVIDTLRGNEDIWDGADITLRVDGTAPTAWVQGDVYLVVLIKDIWTPPYDTYGNLNAWLGTFELDGAEVAYLGGEAVPFADGMSPSEFVEAVRDLVE